MVAREQLDYNVDLIRQKREQMQKNKMINHSQRDSSGDHTYNTPGTEIVEESGDIFAERHGSNVDNSKDTMVLFDSITAENTLKKTLASNYRD